MRSRLYSLGLNEKYERIIRTWEIVDSSERYYWIQTFPDEGLKIPVEIRKDQVCSGYFPSDYYWFKSNLITIETRKQRALILTHESGIVLCKNDLEALNALRKETK